MPVVATVLAIAFLALPAGAAAAKKGPAVGSITAIGGIESLEPTALSRWPDSFGGIWLSGNTLYVAFTDKSRKRMKELRRPLITRVRPAKGGLGKASIRRARSRKARNRLLKRRIQAVTVDDSLLSLRQLEARMIADRDAPPPPSIVVLPRPRYDLEVDVQRNSVVVTTPSATPQLADQLRQTYGDVIVEQGPLLEPQPCNSRDDCPPFLRSGLRSVAESGSSCSLAFNVLYEPGVTGMLSAAHCGTPDADLGDDRLINGAVYGQVVAEQQSGQLDAELHSVGNGYISLFPMIYRSSSDYAAIVGEVGTYDELLIGSTVCKSGWKTEETCGPVLSKTVSPSYIPGGNSFIKADYCSEGGDSGAGVYRSFQRQKPNKKKPVTRYEALGIHSGGAKDTPCSSPQHFAVFGHIEFVQSGLGLKVLSNPN
jgi:hypothetical protein